MIDLSRALHDAADRTTAHRPTIPASPVVTRIRRRRAVRTATSSAAGVAAAGAVAFGALQLAGERPAPPASPAPTTTTDPLACGAAVDTLAPADDLDVRVEVALEDAAEGGTAVMTAERTLAARVTTTFPTDAGVDDEFGHWTALAAVQDGVVAGWFETADRWDTTRLSGRLGVSDRYELTGRRCDGTVAQDAPLAPGEYDLYVAVGDVSMAGGSVMAGPFLAEPVPFTYGGADVAPVDLPPLPACGEPADDLAPSASGLDGTASVQIGVVGTGGEFVNEGHGDTIRTELPVTNATGAVLHGMRRAGSALAVVQDGVVVARWGDETDLEGSSTTGMEWEPGTPDLLVRLDALDRCDGVDALPAGGYELWARTEIEAATEPGGTVRTFAVLHAPVPFTVHEIGDANHPGAVTWTSAGPVGPGANATDGVPALEELVVSTAGLGPLALGSTMPTTSSLAGAFRWEADHCAGTDDPGRWVAAYHARMMENGGAGSPFQLLVTDGRVERIDVLTYGPTTAAGVGVGSTLDQVRAAHPVERIGAAADLGLDAWALRDGDAMVVFEVAANGADDGLWSPEEVGTVVAVAITSTAYGYPAWGADLCG